MPSKTSKTFAIRVSIQDTDDDVVRKMTNMLREISSYRFRLQENQQPDIPASEWLNVRDFVLSRAQVQRHEHYIEFVFDFPSSYRIEGWKKFKDLVVALANSDSAYALGWGRRWEFDRVSPDQHDNLVITLRRIA